MNGREKLTAPRIVGAIFVMIFAVPVAAILSAAAGLVAYFVVRLLVEFIGTALTGSSTFGAIVGFIASGAPVYGLLACVVVTGGALQLCLQSLARIMEIKIRQWMIAPAIFTAFGATIALMLFWTYVSPPINPSFFVTSAITLVGCIVLGLIAVAGIYSTQFRLSLPQAWNEVPGSQPKAYLRSTKGSGRLEIVLGKSTGNSYESEDQAEERFRLMLETRKEEFAKEYGKALLISHERAAIGPMAFACFRKHAFTSQIWVIEGKENNIFVHYQKGENDVAETDIPEVHDALKNARYYYIIGDDAVAANSYSQPTEEDEIGSD